MPFRKQDATRAMELLEEYQKRLNSPSDLHLRSAIERVIKIFKSRLFNALLEIHEFYEATLLDETMSSEQKTVETLRVADRWTNARSLQSATSVERDSSHPRLLILVRRPADGDVIGGFGFSVAGGSSPSSDVAASAADSECNFGIRVTKVSPGGVADSAGLKVGDILLEANGVSLIDCRHSEATAILKSAGDTLKLLIINDNNCVNNASYRGVNCLTVKLVRDGGLGFSVAGGVGNGRDGGDEEIFVTKVIPGSVADRDGRISPGDKLIAVNGRSLTGVTHSRAVEILKSAGESVTLTVAKATAAERREFDAAGEEMEMEMKKEMEMEMEKEMEMEMEMKGSRACLSVLPWLRMSIQTKRLKEDCEIKSGSFVYTAATEMNSVKQLVTN